METKVYKSSRISLLLCLEEIKSQLDRDLNNKYDYLIFSIHPSFPIDDVNYLIKKIFDTDRYIAFNAIDTFINDEIIGESVGLVAFKFEKEAKIKKFYIEDIGDYKNNSVLDKTANYLNQNRDSFHMIIAGVANWHIGFFIEDLSQQLNYSPIDNITGGISSGIEVDNELRTYQFTDDKIIKNGFIILSFENIEAKIDISLGFKPYGITYEITKAQGTKIFEVDNGKNFAQKIGGLLKDIKNPDSRYLWYLPINILDEQDGYVATLRTIEEVKENYVKLFGPIRERQHFKMSFATEDELLESDIRCANKIAQKIKRAEVAFNFSCVARQYVLGDRQKEEIGIYTNIFNSYLFGFFTFGEIGPDKMFKKLKLYNETSLVVAMREK